MRFMHCRIEGETRLVAQHHGRSRQVPAQGGHLPDSIEAILQGGLAVLPEIAAALSSASECAGRIEAYEPPVRRPGKILCVGRNYAEHAGEMQTAVAQEPVIFNKLVTTLTGHECPVLLPRESTQVDYEAELVVVIGRAGRDIPEESALDHVFGYTCGQDVSARDWQKQKPGGQWLLGKSFDHFSPLGPALVTRDEIKNVHDLDIELRLNGQVMQRSSTRLLLFSIPRLIAYISRVCTLEPGDLLFTGTPGGVGAARQPPVFLQSGDVTEVEIERIGTLRNAFV